MRLQPADGRSTLRASKQTGVSEAAVKKAGAKEAHERRPGVDLERHCGAAAAPQGRSEPRIRK
eukprot:12960252-Alexandrium_andersonii.AAC.1